MKHNSNSSGKMIRAALRAKILEHRLAGKTCREIAPLVGKAHTTVFGILKAALAEIETKNTESTTEILRLELERLDAIHAKHWNKRHWAESARILMAVAERRAKLTGIDKPAKTGFVGADGQLVDPPTLIVEFTDGSTAAATQAETPKGV